MEKLHKNTLRELKSLLKNETSVLLPNGILINSDSSSIIRKMDRNNIKVDAIITDPPYNISRPNNFHTINRYGIDFGKWDVKFNQTNWLKLACNLIKDDGSIIIFNDWKNLGIIQKELVRNGFVEKDILIWNKSNPMPRNTSRRYLPKLEFAIWAVKKGGKWVFNNNGEKSVSPIYDFAITKTTVVIKKSEIQRERERERERGRIHPTQKNLDLLRAFVRRHTNKNDLILDPFSGSGSTCLATLAEERKFIGIEIDKTYFGKSEKWIKRYAKEHLVVKRSPLYYLGDKYKIIPQIKPLMPQNINKFVDVFGGGGTLLSNIDYQSAIYNDNNKFVKKLLKTIYIDSQQKTPTFSKSVIKIVDSFNLSSSHKTQYNRENNPNFLRNYNVDNFNLLKKEFNKLSLKEASTKYGLERLFVLSVYSFNSQIRFNSLNKYNTPIGKSDLNKNRLDILGHFQTEIASRKIQFNDLDFRTLLSKEFIDSLGKDDYLYFDPPYLVTNATYNAKWDEKSERDLLNILDILTKKGIKWGLNNSLSSKGNENTILKEWLAANKKYIGYKIYSSFSNSNYQRKGADASEVFITNWEVNT